MKYIKKYGAARINDIDDWSLDRVTNALQEGISKGEGASDLGARIKDLFDDMSTYRSESIARTECTTAFNMANIESARESGLKLQKIWIATSDDRTRPTHADADDQTVDLDDKFSVGDEEMDMPGDPDADASETVNCRCTIGYSPVEEEEGEQEEQPSEEETTE